LVDVVNKNAFLIQDLMAEEIDLVDVDGSLSAEGRLYALAMFYRAAIIDLETKLADGHPQ
jgi:hypothetical protein